MKEFDRKAAEKEFEEMCDLYKTDPEAFERKVRGDIERVICDADPQYRDRLRGMQFEIDAKLGKYKDPVARFNKMVELFWDGVNKFTFS